MAGLRGNQASLGFAEQADRATANTTYEHNLPFSGGNLQPSREVDNLAETDANRDQGVSYVRQTGAEGSPEVYVRDASIHRLLYAALGAIATDALGTPNIEHTITPANALPYFTFVKSLGGTLWEQFDACKISELTISSEAGGPLTASFDIAGRQATRLTSAPILPDLADDAVYNQNDSAVTIGGVSTSLVGSFELTISNSVTTQQTDSSVPYDVVEGLREVTLGFSLIFENLTEYNKFHYGGAAGTAQSSDIFTTSAEFVFSKGANNDLTFTLPSIAYEEFPVEPDPGGDPIVVDVRARAQRGDDPVLTAVVNNQTDAPA